MQTIDPAARISRYGARHIREASCSTLNLRAETEALSFVDAAGFEPAASPHSIIHPINGAGRYRTGWGAPLPLGYASGELSKSPCQVRTSLIAQRASTCAVWGAS